MKMTISDSQQICNGTEWYDFALIEVDGVKAARALINCSDDHVPHSYLPLNPALFRDLVRSCQVNDLRLDGEVATALRSYHLMESVALEMPDVPAPVMRPFASVHQLIEASQLNASAVTKAHKELDRGDVDAAVFALAPELNPVRHGKLCKRLRQLQELGEHLRESGAAYLRGDETGDQLLLGSSGLLLHRSDKDAPAGLWAAVQLPEGLGEGEPRHLVEGLLATEGMIPRVLRVVAAVLNDEAPARSLDADAREARRELRSWMAAEHNLTLTGGQIKLSS